MAQGAFGPTGRSGPCRLDARGSSVSFCCRRPRLCWHLLCRYWASVSDPRAGANPNALPSRPCPPYRARVPCDSKSVACVEGRRGGRTRGDHSAHSAQLPTATRDTFAAQHASCTASPNLVSLSNSHNYKSREYHTHPNAPLLLLRCHTSRKGLDALHISSSPDARRSLTIVPVHLTTLCIPPCFVRSHPPTQHSTCPTSSSTSPRTAPLWAASFSSSTMSESPYQRRPSQLRHSH